MKPPAMPFLSVRVDMGGTWGTWRATGPTDAEGSTPGTWTPDPPGRPGSQPRIRVVGEAVVVMLDNIRADTSADTRATP